MDAGGAARRDDLAWAAAWLYRETGDKAYLSDAYAFYTQHQDLEGDYDIRYLARSARALPRCLCLTCLL